MQNYSTIVPYFFSCTRRKILLKFDLLEIRDWQVVLNEDLVEAWEEEGEYVVANTHPTTGGEVSLFVLAEQQYIMIHILGSLITEAVGWLLW